MKSSSRSARIAAWIFLGVMVILASLALSRPIQTTQENTLSPTAVSLTVTPTIEVESEVGSTDGVVLVGILIVSIVILPILFRWNEWATNGR